MQYKINLKAGVPIRQEVIGRTLVVLDTGATTFIDMKVELAGFAAEEFRNIKRGFRLSGPGFTSVYLQSAVDATVELVSSFANIDVNYTDGSAVNATLVGTPTVLIGNQPIQVVNDKGTVGNPLYVSGVTYTDAPATSVKNNAPVAASPVVATIMAALVNRKAARITNLGPDPVAVGGAGLTWAQRTIILNVGDIWVEERGANVQWTAITDAAKSASVAVQEVLA